MTMVEHRRLRTWEADAAAAPMDAWRIVLRYGIIRCLRAWWIVLPLVAVLVSTVIAIGASSYEWSAAGAASHGHVLGMVSLFLLQGAVFIFLVGTPLMAEDLRYHAPLFYFSKPLRAGQYFKGKAALLLLFLAITVLIPFIVMLLLGAVTSLGGTPQGLSDDELERWRLDHLDTVGDWLYTAAVLIPGVTVALAFAAGVTLAVSTFTRRAWHAAMGLVAILGGWSLLAAVASEVVDNALAQTFGPAGWLYLVVVMPVSLRFNTAAGEPLPDAYRHAGEAIAIAYVALLACTYLAARLAIGRLQQQEAIL